MHDRIFGLNNPNADVMVVPVQEGGSDEDGYFGSIGDATMQHVYSLNGAGLVMWNELYHAGSGAMFRSIPSSSWHDNDPFNLRGKDLDLWIKEYVRVHYDGDIPEKDLVALTEAIQEEQLRREASEDVYDEDDNTLVPYDEWEKFPQMWNAWEVPRTPRDIMIYVGNSRDTFYDTRPDGHPDMPLIESYLQRLNRDWDVLTAEEADQYCDYLCEELVKVAMIGKAKMYTIKYLTLLIKKIQANEGSPEEHAEWALGEIDRCWSIEYMNSAAKKMKTDGLYQLMIHKQVGWLKDAKAGQSVYANVKSLGQTLYEDHKDDMRGHHWAFYRRMKLHFAPNVMVRGVNVNHGILADLERLVGDRNTATTMWQNRPFDSVQNVFNNGYITRKTFSDSPEMELILKRIDSFATKVKETKNLQNFQPIVRAMIDGQKVGTLNMGKHGLIKLDQKEWTMVWAYYRMSRQDLQDSFNREEREARKKNEQAIGPLKKGEVILKDSFEMSAADELDAMQAEEIYG